MSEIVTFSDYNCLASDGINTIQSLKSKLIDFSVLNKNVFDIENTLGGPSESVLFVQNLKVLLQEFGKEDHQCKKYIDI